VHLRPQKSDVNGVDLGRMPVEKFSKDKDKDKGKLDGCVAVFMRWDWRKLAVLACISILLLLL